MCIEKNENENTGEGLKRSYKLIRGKLSERINNENRKQKHFAMNTKYFPYT